MTMVGVPTAADSTSVSVVSSDIMKFKAENFGVKSGAGCSLASVFLSALKFLVPIIIFSLIAVFSPVFPLQSVCAAPVTAVSVEVRDAEGGTGGLLLQKMGRSMQVVAEQLFNGRDQEKIEQDKEAYSSLLQEISDRVITGYRTVSVSLSSKTGGGAVTEYISFSVLPWGKRVENVEVDLQYSGISKGATKRISGTMNSLKKEIEQSLIGISVDSTEWAAGVVRNKVNLFMDAELPEFKAAVDLSSRNGKTYVQIIIYPIGEMVGNVKYSMVSTTVPNVLLVNLKYDFEKRAGELRGLPLAYVKKHKNEIEQDFSSELLKDRRVGKYNLLPEVKITPGVTTLFDIKLESDRYKIYFEGYADAGRQDRSVSGKAHIGKFFSPESEVFTEIGLDLKDTDWDFALGYSFHRGKAAWSVFGCRPGNKAGYRFTYGFTPLWQFRAEHLPLSNEEEYAVRYRIHEFLSGEYVYSSEKSYFRLIGNL